MTVADLIKHLSTLPETAVVEIKGYSCKHGFFEAEAADREDVTFDKSRGAVVFFAVYN